jgi:anaerobic ribonucleoside-triphosphate reductase activating protein
MLKFVNTGVVFQEIPDETTLSINISNCPNHCPGCHSQYLWQNIGEDLNEAAIDKFVDNFGKDITCICLMGGDSDMAGVQHLAEYIHAKYPSYKVGWYSGKLRLPMTVNKLVFDYIKIGPYIANLGPLNKPTTNQRLYKKTPDGKFEDITYRFWNKNKMLA